MESREAENLARKGEGPTSSRKSPDSWHPTADSCTSCEREAELVEALTSGRGPEAWGDDLRRHVTACAVCAEIALVAQAFEQENDQARVKMALPAAGLVWWKAQMRARREAAERAAQPIAIVERLAWVSGVLSLLGAAIWQRGWIEEWLIWLGQTVKSGHFAWSTLWTHGNWAVPWSLAVMMVMGPLLLVTALIYAVLADR